MTLIAESGATKTDWVFGDCRVRTKGINISVMSDSDISLVISEALSSIGPMLGFGEVLPEVDRLYYYGAGLVSASAVDRLRCVFEKFLPNARMEFASDLMASARALWGNSPGVVAILGSGSNSCSYDGSRITKNVRPGGYILGDEGGGVSLGRRFIADYIKNLLPASLASEFSEEYRLNYEAIVEAVYRGRNPAGFLASFAPFVVSRTGKSEYARDLVADNFRSFIQRSLYAYRIPDETLAVGVSGSLGCNCKDILNNLGQESGIEFVKFIESPVQILPAYHAR